MKDLIPEGLFLISCIIVMAVLFIAMKQYQRNDKSPEYVINVQEAPLIESVPRSLPEPQPVKEVLVYYREYATPSDAAKGLALMEQAEESNMYMGWYYLTAYCPTGNLCADEAMPQVSYTAACNNPELWHKWVHIDGYGDYYVHDHLADWVGTGTIDIFMGSHEEAIRFGRQYGEVYVIE